VPELNTSTDSGRILIKFIFEIILGLTKVLSSVWTESKKGCTDLERRAIKKIHMFIVMILRFEVQQSLNWTHNNSRIRVVAVASNASDLS